MSNKPGKKPASLRAAAARKAQEEAQAAAMAQQRRRNLVKGVIGGIALIVLIAITVVVLTRPSDDPTSTVSTKPPKVAVAQGCTACHTSDGSRAEGPTWQGLYNSNVQLTDGSTVRADERYLADSIINPQHVIVAGYEGSVMPKKQLTDQQVAEIVTYIMSLSGS